jgi:MFS family permease
LAFSPLFSGPLLEDRLSGFPKKIMIGGCIVYALSSAAYLVARPFWPLMIVRAFQGMGWAFFATAVWTLASKIIPDARRGQGLSYFFLAHNCSFAMAPSLGIFVVNQFNFTVLFLVCSSLSLCSLLITFKLVAPPQDLGKDHSIPAQREPLFSWDVVPSSIIAFISNSVWGAVTAFFPLFALRHGMTNPGFFFTALAITLILARVFGGKVFDLYDRKKIILPCLGVQTLAMSLLSFSTTPPLFILVAVIWGLGNAFLFPALMAHILDQSKSARGPAISTYMALTDLGAGLGPVIMGIILQLTSYRVMFLSVALTCLLNLCYFCYILTKRRGIGDANL